MALPFAGIIASKLFAPIISGVAVAATAALIWQTARIEGTWVSTGYKEQVAELRVDLGAAEKERDDNRAGWDTCNATLRKTVEDHNRDVQALKDDGDARVGAAQREADRLRERLAVAQRQASAATTLADELRQTSASQCEAVQEFRRRVLQ